MPSQHMMIETHRGTAMLDMQTRGTTLCQHLKIPCRAMLGVGSSDQRHCFRPALPGIIRIVVIQGRLLSLSPCAAYTKCFVFRIPLCQGRYMSQRLFRVQPAKIDTNICGVY